MKLFWLKHLFAVGRLRREPPGQRAGRLLGPASVQRSHLGVREVDLPAGVITMRDGSECALLRVSGMPLQHASPAEARRFLVPWALALHWLPAETVLLVRSRPGGLVPLVEAQGVLAVALSAYTLGSGMARLVEDQLAHLRRLHEEGQTRQHDCLVMLRVAAGNRAALLQALTAASARFQEAGLQAEHLTADNARRSLLDAWQPVASLP